MIGIHFLGHIAQPYGSERLMFGANIYSAQSQSQTSCWLTNQPLRSSLWTSCHVCSLDPFCLHLFVHWLRTFLSFSSPRWRELKCGLLLHTENLWFLKRLIKTTDWTNDLSVSCSCGFTYGQEVGTRLVPCDLSCVVSMDRMWRCCFLQTMLSCWH